MILCDIGNSFYHFYKNGKVWKEPIQNMPSLGDDEDIFAVSVNDEALERLSKKYSTMDLSRFLDFDSDYVGLGVDRAFVCYAANDGVVVDAGSAITVDIMQEGLHLGGFILPGISTYVASYGKISKRLDVGFNMGVDIKSLPQNTKDAVSYGTLISIVGAIKEASRNKFIYFTGGDGKFLSRFFEDRSAVDDTLIFKGMLKLMNRESIC